MLRKKAEAVRKRRADLISWPVAWKKKVIIHLSDLDPVTFAPREGDFYFQVTQQTDSKVAGLVLKYYHDRHMHCVPVSEQDYGTVFAMDGLHMLSMRNNNDNLKRILRYCLVAVERGIERMTWEEVTSQSDSYDHDMLAMLETNMDVWQKRTDLKKPSSMGAEVEPLTMPQYIMDVNFEVLHSGTAVLTGSRDKKGGAIVVIYTNSPMWLHNTVLTSTELARLLIYYHTVPRADVQSHGLSVIVDARKSSEITLSTLLKALHLIQDNLPGAIAIVHMLVDKDSQSILLKSRLLRTDSGFKVDLLSSADLLQKFVDVDQLPQQMGGTYSYHHDDWIRFRMQLEPFMNTCRSAAKFLVGIMQEMTSLIGMPTTVEETQEVMSRHKRYVQRAFEDPRLVSLQNEGDAVMIILNKEDSSKTKNDDFKAAIKDVTTLYKEVQDSMNRLVQLANDRVEKLEQCLQLRQFESESAVLVAWLEGEGADLLKKHSSLCDNLKAIRKQQKDFEKQYFDALTRLERGSDLLEDVSLLTQSEKFNECHGLKEQTRHLKKHMTDFTTRLEEVRENIENTSSCYQMLDQAYEWALEAMKYVASMKMEACTSQESLHTITAGLEDYLKSHQPVSAESFDKMAALANKVNNDKLVTQCKSAQSRCVETEQLLKIRALTLSKAGDRLASDKGTTGSSTADMVVRRRSLAGSHLRTSTSASSMQCHPHMMSSRRRSYGGVPSNYLNTSANRNSLPGHVMEALPNLSEHHEQLYHDGLITEDHCLNERVVTSIPKSLADSTMRNSRENLRQSLENLSTSCSKTTDSASNNMATRGQSSGDLQPGRFRKYKRASTCSLISVPSNDPEFQNLRQAVRQQRDAKTISLITGSTESIPSLPEDEEENKERKTWSPIPVNTHLLRQTLTHAESMSDLRLKESEIKSRRKLAWIMREIVETEHHYVRSLQYMIDHYIPELSREDVPQALRGKRNLIFGNLEKIYDFHSRFFLQEIEKCERSPFKLAYCFINHESQFYYYALYNKNKPKSEQLMCEYGSQFFRQKQLELGDKMDLASYLLKPVQRMGKYALLLKQIIKECPDYEPEYPYLKAAEDMVKFQLRHGNDLLAVEALKDCDVNLQEQGKILRQDQFLVWQGRKKSLRHVFLFEELVVFAKTKRNHTGNDTYIYRNSIKTSDMGLTETVGDSGYKFELWYLKRKLGENYILQASGVQHKAIWVQEISRLLWRQAIRNREVRLQEMTSMGIGSKPCLDLAASDDNINDRFVNIGLSNKPRHRNSIAISSFDHLKLNNKRPHSIISTSSTSSSSSSQGSYGIFGYLHLATDSVMMDQMKPPEYRRSCTMSSIESGICADMSGESEGRVERSPSDGSVSSYLPQTPSSTGSSNSTMVTDV